MFQIDLKNIQAIGDGHIVFEDNSIVEFTGDNSNGKSVISKIIEAMTKGDIRHKDVRNTLIKDGCEQGVAVFTHNEKQLGLILSREVKDSLVLFRPNHEKEPDNVIARPMSDGDGCDALIKEFGFRSYNDGNICLQLSPTFGAIPFVTTSGSVNSEIVMDITVDKIAEDFISTFHNITFPLFKDRIARLELEKNNAQTVIDNMESYDWKAYDAIGEEMREIYLAISEYEYFNIEDIHIPDLSIFPVSNFKFKEIPIVHAFELARHITIDEKSINDYSDIMNGVCPTCGKPLVGHEH